MLGKKVKAYRQLQAEEQRINFEMLNATSESQRKKLKSTVSCCQTEYAKIQVCTSTWKKA